MTNLFDDPAIVMFRQAESNRACDKPTMATKPEILRARIQERLDAVGLNANAASVAAGLDRTTLGNFLRNADPTKGMNSKSLSALSRVLQYSTAYLLGETDITGNPTSAIPENSGNVSAGNEKLSTAILETFPVYGTTAAGAFRPIMEDTDQTPLSFISGTRHQRFRRFKHFALIVEGDSMNLSGISHGDTIVCVDWVEVGMAEVSGLVVVVERTLNAGQLREWSVKEIEVLEDRILFHPRSTNPIHKPIVVMRDHSTDNGMEVRIMGLVVKVEKNLFPL